MDLNPLITLDDLEPITEVLHKALRIGVYRAGDATDQDGGVWAFDSGVDPLPAETSYASEEVVIAGFGGTNWQAGVARIKDGQVAIEMRSTRSFAAHERQFATPEQFFDTMIEVILAGFAQTPPSTLALSFGFLHHNQWVETGLDAVIPVDAPAKFWHIQGLAHQSLSQGLITAARKRHWNLSKIVVANDTVGSVLSKPGSQMAVVAGTGVNAAVAVPDARHGHVLNLEVGRAAVLPMTACFQWLFDRSLLPSNNLCLEYAAGGEFHRYHLMSMAHMAGESDMVIEAIRIGTPSLVSDIVFNPIKALSGLPPRTLPDEWWREHSQAILNQASLVLASLVISLLKLSSQDNDSLLVEGSVFWVAPGVSDRVLELVEAATSRRLYPIKAPGMEGLVRLALSR